MASCALQFCAKDLSTVILSFELLTLLFGINVVGAPIMLIIGTPNGILLLRVLHFQFLSNPPNEKRSVAAKIVSLVWCRNYCDFDLRLRDVCPTRHSSG